ncbi:MAG: anaerobic benzoate catabolism transcriptional regulator [Syntrophorhabdus sp. PtaU1.Bin050]|nr:MAG: anaerobic benzoate catabolism transcriptional regulator [Syntrophorhabdus sp. PtaU1.Bin050]
MNKKPADHDIFYQQLGVNIRKHRKQQGMSQETLAQSLDLTRTSLTNIEKGRQHPSVYTLCEIGRYLKVGVSELLPQISPQEKPIDLKVLIGGQVQSRKERDFIETAIKGGK